MGLKLQLVERQQDVSQDRGTFGHFCVLDSGLVFVASSYGVVLFMSLISPWPSPRQCAVYCSRS